MVMFKRYGQMWYTTRNEAEKYRTPPDIIVYDSGLDAYYIKQVQSIWDF